MVGFSVMTQWEIDTDFTRDLPCSTQGPMGEGRLGKNLTEQYKIAKSDKIVYWGGDEKNLDFYS